MQSCTTLNIKIYLNLGSRVHFLFDKKEDISPGRARGDEVRLRVHSRFDVAFCDTFVHL